MAARPDELNFSALAAVLDSVIYERVLAQVTEAKLDALIQIALERCVTSAVDNSLHRICGGFNNGRGLQEKVTAVIEETLADVSPNGLEGYVEKLVWKHFAPAQQKRLVLAIKQRISAATKTHLTYRMDDAVIHAVETAVCELIAKNADVLTEAALKRMAAMAERHHGTRSG